jgi:type IV secretion system protein VirB5
LAAGISRFGQRQLSVSGIHNRKERSMLTQGIRLRSWVLAGLLAAPAAQAQFAVVDVGAITQLVTQVHTLEEQLATARDHLTQAQAEFNSMTGSRGMERLLAGVQRNYLPADWSELHAALLGGGAHNTLTSDMAGLVDANSVLTAGQLATLPPDVSQHIYASRQLASLLQGISRDALSNTSNRFASLQQLIDALPAANDQKAVLELQARVGAENAMLENEQTKLQTLYQTVQAEARANEQQIRERAIVGHGLFGSRFQPTP